MDGRTVIDVDDLRMRYGQRDVVDGVSFRVRAGEVVALLGPNGAGKTTTIEILEGFRMRSAGRVAVLDEDPAHAGERWRARTGVVLQSWRDHGKWRVRELLAQLGAYYAAYREPWDPDELVAAVGLTEHADRKLRTLSGGQRRRLDVAVGIVGRPEVLFLDEPTTGFDPEARRGFHDLVRGLAGREGTAVLLTTHDLDEAERLADRILVLSGGRVVADGTSEDLARRIAGEDEVRWTHDGHRLVHRTRESTRFAFDLFRRYGDEVTGLEVRRASLENSYLELVRRAEAGPPEVDRNGDLATARQETAGPEGRS